MSVLHVLKQDDGWWVSLTADSGVELDTKWKFFAIDN